MIPILKLVERQIAMAGVRNHIEKAVEPPGRYVTRDGIAFGPYLLISRECGSGSSLLAQIVGERLGWNVFDSKIVDEIAKVARVQERLVQSVDEHVHSAWEQTWRELLLEELPDKKYLHHLSEVIMTLGHQGNVVLVGRGAQYFLPPECSLRVRLVAPLETRAQRVAGRKNISLEEARLRVNEIDSERAAFIRKTFQKDVRSPLNQDLVVNTGNLGIENTADIVLAALEKKLGIGPKEQTGLEKHASAAG
jgi:hypothetical protein